MDPFLLTYLIGIPICSAITGYVETMNHGEQGDLDFVAIAAFVIILWPLLVPAIGFYYLGKRRAYNKSKHDNTQQ